MALVLGLLGSLVMSGAFAAGCHLGHAETEDRIWQAGDTTDAIAVEITEVVSRPVERTIHLVGTLDAFETIRVTPKVEGKVAALYADVGDRVLPGALLLELDPVDYRLAVQEAEKALEAELARLGLTEPPDGDFDVAQLPSIQRAEAVLENAWRRYQREKEVLQRSAGSVQAFEQAETDWKVADAQLRQARLEAQATLAAVRLRQAMLATARQRLEDTKLFVPYPAEPYSGSLAPSYEYAVAERFVSVGEMVRVFPSTAAFTLVRDDVLKFRVLVPERYLSSVRPDLKVTLLSDAYPGEKFSAHIARIYPTIDPVNRTFQVECHVHNIGQRLKPGGFARAEVVLEKNDEALMVPREAILRVAGVTKVFVVDKARARAVEVQLGVEDREWIEIRGPLRAGDRVVVEGHTRLVDGSAVRVRTGSDSRETVTAPSPNTSP